ncbi:MAG: hypothetical protein Q8R29_01125 [bacterium]|nr:hypothetical protein [bacterium]
MEKLKNRNILILLGVIVVAGLVILLFKKKEALDTTPTVVNTPVITSTDSVPKKQDTVTASGASNNPKYTGRDPEEVHPNPDDVKIFSEKRKEEIYSGITVHGRNVKENPDFLNGWLELGILKKVIGDYEGARDAWEYANIIRPGNSISFSNLGELYWRYLPNYTKSEANFKTSIKNKSDDPSVYISLSDLYFYSYAEKKDFADDILLEGTKANPEDTNLVRALAALYERQKEYTKAKEWWTKLLEKEPNDAEITAHIKGLGEKINP